MKTELLVEQIPAPDAEGHVLRALLRLHGDAPAEADRMPLNLSVVLDNSGSMRGDKLRYARDAACQLLASVHPDDTTSVVTFASHVDVVAPAERRAAQVGLEDRVRSIGLGGCTNLSGGWLEGRTQVDRHATGKACNRVIVMTDGHANRGIVDPDRLGHLMTRARLDGVTTTTIGFGDGFDEALLERLADAGGGNAHYIENPDQAPDIFRAELDELLALSAQNVVADLHLEPGVEIAAIHHSYPREPGPGGVRLRLGDVYASEPKQLLLELGVRQVGTEPTRLATLVIRGDMLDPDGSMEQREITLPLSFSPEDGLVVDAEVRRTLTLLQVAAARREALDARARGEHEDAAATLRAAAHKVRAEVPDEEGREEADDLERMALHLDRHTFAEAEAKYVRSRSRHEMRGKSLIKQLMSRERYEERKSRTRSRRKAWSAPNSTFEGASAAHIPLRLENDHLFLELADGLWLFDTGAPSSFGRSGKVSIAGRSLGVGSSYMGLDGPALSKSVGVEVAGLLGADVLNTFDHVLDLPAGRAVISERYSRNLWNAPVSGGEVVGMKKAAYPSV